MNSFTYKNPKQQFISVYYTGSDTIKKGYLLCFDHDSTTDLDGETVADGKFCNGRFLKVEQPTSANIPYGYVIAAAGRSGAGFLTCIVPNGAAAQVFADFSVTIGDVFYLDDQSYYAHDSGYAGIGTAMETINRSTEGLCGMRLGTVVAVTGSTATSLTTALSANTALVASAKLIYDSTQVLESGDVVSIDLITSSAKVIYDSIQVLESGDVVSIDLITSSAKVIYDSIKATDIASVDTVFSILDSVGTEITSADTSVSVLGSQLVQIIDALKAIGS